MQSADNEIKLEESWKNRLGGEFSKDYMRQLKAFLVQEKQQGKAIFPKGSEFFKALDTTPFEQVKVVILGQDPYHGPNQAHGLSFSVPQAVPIPPSLQNIFKELQDNLGIAPASHGCLIGWAQQGVLLLNAVLSVERHKAASHQGRGWEHFTDAVINRLNQEREGIVFMLWGSYAQRKGAFIDSSKHLVLKAPHPSPLSAHRGFLGCGHFSKANDYLMKRGEAPIDWTLSPLP